MKPGGLLGGGGPLPLEHFWEEGGYLPPQQNIFVEGAGGRVPLSPSVLGGCPPPREVLFPTEQYLSRQNGTYPDENGTFPDPFYRQNRMGLFPTAGLYKRQLQLTRTGLFPTPFMDQAIRDCSRQNGTFPDCMGDAKTLQKHEVLAQNQVLRPTPRDISRTLRALYL